MNKEIILDEYVDDLPLACAEYRTKIKMMLKDLCNDIIALCADNAEADCTIIDCIGDSIPGDMTVEAYVLKNSILDVKKLIK
jgi:hypothetical protein